MVKKYRVFIDGAVGTTGLQVRQRLDRHELIEVIDIDLSLRKDLKEKRALIASADVTVLCLPDKAAEETVALCDSTTTRFLDASSAHRTAAGWVYGLPELHREQRERIRGARLVANPGCYATGAVLLLRPLIDAALIGPAFFASLTAISGYSGGGKSFIDRYENTEHSQNPDYAMYGLSFDHKHIPEIQTWSLLKRRPLLLPSVGNFSQGMLVQVVVNHELLSPGVDSGALHTALKNRYADERFVEVMAHAKIDDIFAPFLTPHGLNGSNTVQIFCFGSSEFPQSLLVAKLDNLGKGASGAAVQNLNIMLGLPEAMAVDLTE